MNNNLRGQQSPVAILIFSISLIATSTTLISTAEIFSDVTVISGIDFKHTDGGSRQRLFNEFLGAGGGFFDYDNDWDLDVYLVSGTLQTSSESDQLPYNRLYRNDGDDGFTDVTQMAGVGDTGYGIGCTVGDYDNDGDLDLYLTNFGSNVLYQNSG
ncbi:MAG: VCBS repeat-containing protein, partial [Candidatus Poribacteria bacterium]|nr:VCBS repeat-containing protein [Candidatus Poribacteria bacterium]